MGAVKMVVRGVPARDGAGVNLVRVLGRGTVVDFDPFLMLDSFDSRDPDDYIRGFPMHPHRGIETLTYLVKGEIDHEDSLGNKGKILDGSAQWMTAGSGIMHKEMPQPSDRMLGIQLWINLPSGEKLTIPKYFDIQEADISKGNFDFGVIRVISGELLDVKGLKPNHLEVDFYDVELYENETIEIPKITEKNAFLFLLEGDVEIDNEKYFEKSALLLSDESSVSIKASGSNARILFIQGPPVKEPIAWGGPVVMNTQAELQEAYRDLRENTFIKHNI
ncbi:pirin family protein [Microaceticoccus formicicus]|uniref:pirin family protein n=1 Tax=Microaceticoccus formicicus TaxID=3118105 RepID=UPI003CD01D0F|nr:pirin family protein [Peptoniphilaceae bacterium AMB_02]